MRPSTKYQLPWYDTFFIHLGLIQANQSPQSRVVAQHTPDAVQVDRHLTLGTPVSRESSHDLARLQVLDKDAVGEQAIAIARQHAIDLLQQLGDIDLCPKVGAVRDLGLVVER